MPQFVKNHLGVREYIFLIKEWVKSLIVSNYSLVLIYYNATSIKIVTKISYINRKSSFDYLPDNAKFKIR